MCGRYTLSSPDASIAELLDLSVAPSLAPRYNIAPSQLVAVLRTPPAREVRELELLRWGLVPGWAKDAAIGNRLINARCETAAEKPSFRTALRRRRCLVVADGFYEWRKLDRRRQPCHIRMVDGRPFTFAGLWEHWQSPDGEPVESCTILTTAANELLAPIHERMPVILAPGDHALWLDPAVTDAARVQPLLRPYSPTELVAQPVSTHVNSPRNDDPRCIEPLAADEA